MSFKKPLYTVPTASTNFTTEAHWDGVDHSIRFAYTEAGTRREGGIRFDGVAAVQWRAERCCTAWHIEDAYDTLVEVMESDWAVGIRLDMDVRWVDHWETHHYMIYLDGGCFEVIAASWNALC